MLVVEDLHWGDEATLDLVRFLGRRIGALPLLLVLSYRETVGPAAPAARRARRPRHHARTRGGCSSPR